MNNLIGPGDDEPSRLNYSNKETVMSERDLRVGREPTSVRFSPNISEGPASLEIYSPAEDEAESYLVGQLSLKDIEALWKFLDREFPNQRPPELKQVMTQNCRLSDTGQHQDNGKGQCLHCKAKLKGK